MLNLREYQENPQRLADYLPWACLPAPNVVLNKDGAFQKTYRYRGPDLESATEAELVSPDGRKVIGGTFLFSLSRNMI